MRDLKLKGFVLDIICPDDVSAYTIFGDRFEGAVKYAFAIIDGLKNVDDFETISFNYLYGGQDNPFKTSEHFVGAVMAHALLKDHLEGMAEVLDQ